MEFVIPQELLVNILVRLSIKDISRLKLVCKSWLKLISSEPYFTSNYVRNSPFTLIFRAQPGDPISLSLLEFNGEEEHTQILPIPTPKLPDYDSRMSIIGSCDCSVFILHCKSLDNGHVINRVYSFNPVSGSRVVKLVTEDITGREPMQYEVGFIPSNSTYKLLRFGLFSEKVEIFTVGSGENWRKVDDDDLSLFHDALTSFEEGIMICLNGSYHWLANDELDTIYTFHLLEEKCGARIPKPHDHDMSQRRGICSSRVTIINDRLSVADLSDIRSYDDSSSTLVVWTMREYGVVESWSKLFVLTFNHTYRGKTRYFDPLPIAVLANGDILFSDKNTDALCLYNLQEKRVTQVIDLPYSSKIYRNYENTYVPRFCT